jgi:hypothetical protein
MITCPACGTQNAAESNFCIACGSDLNAAATDRKLRTDSVADPAPDTPPMTSPSVDMPREYLDTTSAPPPRPAPSPAYVPPVYTPPPAYAAGSTAYPSTPAKDRTIALVIEVIGGLFGLLGIGWLYAGNTTAGILWLAGMLIGTCLAVTLDIITAGFFVCVHIPLWLAAIGVSAYLLYNYTRQHPETFGV